jgi:hypothetical protein
MTPEELTGNAPPPLSGIDAVRAMDDLRMKEIRELRDELRRHHRYIAGLTGDSNCRICGDDL